MKTGIVCEGGGMRGIYTAGVLQAFMDGGFVADELVGVSAGASNGASYVSGQPGRGFRTNYDYVGDKRYLSVSNLIHTRSIFGMDFIFGEIPDRLDPFDYEAFQRSSTDYYAGATNVETGKAVFFGKDKIVPGLEVLRASCSMPVLAPIMEIDGGKYLDGGVAAPIPFEKALADGCEKLVVLLTRPRGYSKKAMGYRLVYNRMYKEYPRFVSLLDVKHLVYNHALAKLERLEEAGRAVVIAPEKALKVDRFGQDAEELAESFVVGVEDGKRALDLL